MSCEYFACKRQANPASVWFIGEKWTEHIFCDLLRDGLSIINYLQNIRFLFLTNSYKHISFSFNALHGILNHIDYHLLKLNVISLDNHLFLL